VRRWLAVVLLVGLASACERQADAPAQGSTVVELDAGALRASAVDGLEAAAADPAIASTLGLASALARNGHDHDEIEIEVALERMLARVYADARLSDAAERLFVDLQASPATRAALADYARANPELDLRELTEGFVGYVDERLTRPAIADAIASALRTQLHRADPSLARALLIDAGGAELLGSAIIVRFADARVRAELERRLGKDPAALQQRLERRLADPGRVGGLIATLGEAARAEPGLAAIVEILDHDQSAALLAASLTRALDDADLRARAASLYGLALAEQFDDRSFARELRELLDQPAVVREAVALREAVARQPFVRERVASLVRAVSQAPGFSATLLDTLAGPASG